MRRLAANVLLVFAALRLSAAPVTCASVGSMETLLRQWAVAYNASHVDAPVRLTLRTPFSAGAFDALVRGELDIAPFSRELFPSEVRRYRARFGRPPALVPIGLGSRDTKGGTHAIAIFVSANNPLARLTVAQLADIFAVDGRIRTWGDLGLNGVWAHRAIVVHGMAPRRASGDPPGVVNYLEQRVLTGRAWRPDITTHMDVANGPQALELIVRAVAADDAAIGYSGFAYAQPGTKTLALADSPEVPFYAGTAEEVAAARYPLTRKIYLCTAPGPSDGVRAFVAFVLSPEGQAYISRSGEGFFPIPRA